MKGGRVGPALSRGVISTACKPARTWLAVATSSDKAVICLQVAVARAYLHGPWEVMTRIRASVIQEVQ